MSKLLILSQSHAIYGGVETIIADLCRELPARGWEPVLGLGKGVRFNNVEDYRSAWPDLPVIEVDGTGGTRQSRIEAVGDVVARVEPDIVLSARMFDVYPAISAFKAKRKNLRLAVGIRVFEPHYFYDARLYNDVIDLCVTSGAMIADTAINWSRLPADRVVSIPGGVHPPTDQIQIREPQAPLRIGYVGRIEQGQKRILDLVPFLKQLDERGVNYHLDIAGTGPAENELRGAITQQEHTGKVTWHGWQSRDDLYRYIYPDLDCIVHFAENEGVTLAPREAMAHGVVPVVSEFVGMHTERQFIDNVTALTFPVGDVRCAVDNIERLIREQGLLQRLSARALDTQQGIYSFSGAMDAWADAFNTCMEAPVCMGDIPEIDRSSPGRLGRAGVPPWLAQRLRDLVGRPATNNDPGSEWPTRSGLLSDDAVKELRTFASRREIR